MLMEIGEWKVRGREGRGKGENMNEGEGRGGKGREGEVSGHPVTLRRAELPRQSPLGGH